MKFKYNGEKGTLKGVFGYDFSDHRIVDVEGDHVITKLKGNRFFDIVGDIIDVAHKVVEIIKPEPDKTEPEEKPEPEEPKKTGKFGLFKVKGDGEPYSRPERTFESMEECTNFMDENGISSEERIILEGLICHEQ